jgi:hypothetical protein
MSTVQNVLDGSIARYIDPDKTTWVDAELLAYVQKGVNYINQLLINRNDISATKSGTISITSGNETVSFTACTMTDFVAMYKGNKLDNTGVWINNSFLDPCREPERSDYMDDDGTMQTEQPAKYYVGSSYLGFLPVPDDSYTVDCLYFYKQSALTVGSSMPFNDVFNEAISAFVTSMAAARTERDIAAMTALYNELETQALAVTNARNAIRPKMVNRSR